MSGGTGGMAGTGTPPGASGANGTYSGGGLSNTGSQLRVTNTILAANAGGATSGNCAGTIGDGGHNLEFNPTTSCAFAIAARHGDPNLGPLANNGGPTPTMALLTGSAAIDMGDPVACAAPPISGKDQRGLARRADRCSIGAFEADPAIRTHCRRPSHPARPRAA